MLLITLPFLLPLVFLPGGLAVTPSSGCSHPLPASPRAGHSHNFPLEVSDPHLGLSARSYRLHLPTYWPKGNDIPRPLLLDFHGWTGNPQGHESDGHNFFEIADEDLEGGFLLATPKGAGMVDGVGHGHGSWNISKTQGPLGDVCETDRQQWGEITCYDSCASCDSMSSCDFSSCYDDEVFTDTLLDKLVSEYCIDLDSIHHTGISNGGEFGYQVAAYMDRFATIGPWAAAPFLGYAAVPDRAFSMIDFHGTMDDTIPYDLTPPFGVGSGPDGTVLSWDGYRYYDKPRIIRTWAEGLECGPAEPWPTAMDNVQDFVCLVHSGCRGGGEVVHCQGVYGHDYPFGPDRYIEGPRIMWDFMKSHPKQAK